jgi:hypothetical protein
MELGTYFVSARTNNRHHHHHSSSTSLPGLLGEGENDDYDYVDDNYFVVLKNKSTTLEPQQQQEDQTRHPASAYFDEFELNPDLPESIYFRGHLDSGAILSSDNEDWKTWAFSFATQQGDKPYTVADLLEKVLNQDKLLNAGGTKKKATALLAGHGISRPAFKPRNKKKGKQKKRCATKDCKKFVRVHFHKFCDDCYSSHKEKSSAENESSALDDVPATVREQNYNRKLTSLKKKMAQMSSVRNKQKRDALLQQANALMADMADAPAKKNKKKKIEEEPEAGLAELTVNAPTNYELSIHAPKPKPTKKAQVNELDRMLAGALFNALPAARYRQISPCDYLSHS